MAEQNNKPTNTMAILGLIFAFVFPILGLIFSIIAKNQIKTTKENGSGLATAGLIISIVYMAVAIVWIVILLAMAGTVISTIDSSIYHNRYY